MTTGRRSARVERYEEFFGFGEAPFSLAPNPRYLFDSASHSAALAQAVYAIDRREPLVVITGEIGTGKTLLCRTVLQRMERNTFLSVIHNPLLDRDDFLKQLLQDFGVISKDRTTAPSASRHDLVHALEDFLTSLAAVHAHAVVIIDEAQHVRPDVLEQIRLLSNVDDGRSTTLQIILVGQLDLEVLLARPEFRHFQQRVSRRFRLEPLSADEVGRYVEHRLAVGAGAPQSKIPGADELARALAEWDGPEARVTFTPTAIQALWRFSNGLPRIVNLLCDRALEAACALQVRTVDDALIDVAAVALKLPDPTDETRPPQLPLVEVADRPMMLTLDAADTTETSRAKKIAVLIGAMALVGLLIWLAGRSASAPASRPTAQPNAPPISSASPADEGRSPAPAAERRAIAGPTSTTSAPRSAGVPSDSVISTGSESAGDRFEIMVASFRTDSRAAASAAAVAALGLPVRQRTSNGWAQVLAGPFASRTDADAAQQRLTGVGITGTQTVSAGR